MRLQAVLSYAGEEALRLSFRGRVLDIRKLGRVIFADILDYDSKIQVAITENSELSKLFASCIDSGDLIEGFGRSGKTKSGQSQILLDDFRLISKSFETLPKTLNNQAARNSQRYLDLTINASSRKLLEICACICKGIRVMLWERGFQEYPTPIISSRYNGGAAKPFETKIRAIDKHGYLRVTSEVYLKQLIAAGCPAVFEIGSQFRNEGIDKLHLPEFQMLEIYKAYSDAGEILDLVLELFENLATMVNGRPIIQVGERVFPCRKSEWTTVEARTQILESANIDILQDADSLRACAGGIGLACDEHSGYATIVAKLVEKFILEHAEKPTIVTQLPCGMTPLMRTQRADPRFTDRFWLFAGNVDFCDIGSEQDDYFRQEAGLQEQIEELNARHLDRGINEDILRVARFGIPPMGGAGLSLNRLALVLGNISDIKETQTFPLH